jgi:spore coat protein H
MRWLLIWLVAVWLGAAWPSLAASYRPSAKRVSAGDEVFTNQTVRHLRLEIAPEHVETLQRSLFRASQEEQRTDVPVTVREGDLVWSNVAVHIKGSYGSLRPISSKPSLTLNFDEWVPGQTFHGLEKISLNNSVQDPSYLTEKIGRELYNAAGVPTPRADYATVELNGRYVGLYVLTEGWNKQFLRRHFRSTKGNFYDSSGGRDLHRPQTANSGQDPTNHAALARAVDATRETNHARRVELLRRTVDLDVVLRMTALDCLVWNWDGYALGANNYRYFHDVTTDRITFFPHGIDQLFWKANGPVCTGRRGIVVKALLETEPGRDLYLQQLFAIRSNVFDVAYITNRVAQESGRIREHIRKSGVGELARWEAATAQLRNQVLARGRDVDRQLAGLKKFVRLNEGEVLALTNWQPRTRFGSLSYTNRQGQLHSVVRGETSAGAWETVVWLEEGRYQLEGRVRTRGVEGQLQNERGGVGFRVWSDRKDTKGASWSWFPYSREVDPLLGGLIPVMTNTTEVRLTGTTDWTHVVHEFELRQPFADLRLQCSLQGTAGEAMFDASSLKLRRVSAVVSKSASSRD